MDKDAASGVFRPPARFVIVHGSLSSRTDAISALCDSLSGVLALSLSLCGICRTPFLGILTAQPQEDKHVRSAAFPAFVSALQRLQTHLLSPGDADLNTTNTGNPLTRALLEAVRQCQSQSQLFHQLVGYFPQLEVVFISSCPAYSVLPQLREAAHMVDVQLVKKILLVSVDCTRQNDLALLDCDDPADEKEKENGVAGDEEGFWEVVDQVTVKADISHFQNVFKAWLQDDGTDREHLHLFLPDEDVSSYTSRPSMPLKCDVLDRIIPPGQLPQPANFSLQTSFSNATGLRSGSGGGSLSLRHGASNSAAKAGQATVGLHRLRAIARVKAEGVCESVPLLVRSTACWRLDWEELEHNQQRFQALCHLLQEQREVLVVVQEIASPTSSVPSPRGHYIIMPCPTSPVLLIRPIATGELLLPINIQSPASDLPMMKCLSKMRCKLSRLEQMDVYNPLLLDCMLTQCLTANLMQQASTQTNTRKRKAPMPLPGNRKQSAPAAMPTNRTAGRYNQLAMHNSKSTPSQQLSKPYTPPRSFTYSSSMYLD